MPYQNRVDPFGAIFRSPARGNLMGNRGGAIHNEKREIIRKFKGRRWIACLLEFKNIKRTVMSPGLYTELFFLDEATAFAAGHRPCAECRRERFNAFRQAWNSTRRVLAPEIDAELHRARIDERGGKVTWQAPLDSLPDGTFVEIGGSARLVRDGALLLWSPEGYTNPEPPSVPAMVTVLTPQPLVECFCRGYRPGIAVK